MLPEYDTCDGTLFCKNSIYGSSSGVTPPNMAVYAYIYAGKIVQ